VWHDPAVSAPDRPLILLVDDEADIRTIARITLSHLGGFRIAEAASGAEAVELAGRLRPAAVLLDVMMPEMAGTDVLRALQENPVTRDLRVIFLTAKAMPAEVERLRTLGACAIVTKPFEPAVLVQQVRDALAMTAPARGGGERRRPPIAPAAAVVDPAAARDLWGLPGETQADVLGELIELFAVQTPATLDDIRQGTEAGVGPDVRRLAHSLKGSALMLGATTVGELARRIEHDAEAGRDAAIPELVAQIDAALPATVRALRAERARLLAGDDGPAPG
jgi:CheY-like chemotaxis protein/HPt (histidine-containing phosphotransfer) domain-containing protein